MLITYNAKSDPIADRCQENKRIVLILHCRKVVDKHLHKKLEKLVSVLTDDNGDDRCCCCLTKPLPPPRLSFMSELLLFVSRPFFLLGLKMFHSKYSSFSQSWTDTGFLDGGSDL